MFELFEGVKKRLGNSRQNFVFLNSAFCTPESFCRHQVVFTGGNAAANFHKT